MRVNVQNGDGGDNDAAVTSHTSYLAPKIGGNWDIAYQAHMIVARSWKLVVLNGR